MLKGFLLPLRNQVAQLYSNKKGFTEDEQSKMTLMRKHNAVRNQKIHQGLSAQEKQILKEIKKERLQKRETFFKGKIPDISDVSPTVGFERMMKFICEEYAQIETAECPKEVMLRRHAIKKIEEAYRNNELHEVHEIYLRRISLFNNSYDTVILREKERLRALCKAYTNMMTHLANDVAQVGGRPDV